jgi:purine-nucleoside phosphorylase
MQNEIEQAVQFLRKSGITNPHIAVILGTGLGNTFVERITDKISISYKDIPFFPEATVEFHHGKLIYGTVAGIHVLAMQGRFHYYEGYSLQQVTFPVRVMKMLGVQHLLISNAAGNLNRNWSKGQLMLLDDHINLQPDNPLRGRNIDSLGPRFPDMSEPYSIKLNSMLRAIARAKNIILNEGVYACVNGPNLETRAEYRYLLRIGADAVGMSTVPEVIVAKHMDLSCCAISVLTDDCDPENLKPVDISEIIEVAGKAEPQLTELYIELIHQLGQ